jgi:hypothetical protein
VFRKDLTPIRTWSFDGREQVLQQLSSYGHHQYSSCAICLLEGLMRVFKEVLCVRNYKLIRPGIYIKSIVSTMMIDFVYDERD